MNATRYRAVIGWFQARPAACRALRCVSTGAVGAVYVLYIGLLLWLAAGRQTLFVPALTVPAAAFLVGSAVRASIDRPRPYVTLGYQPLFPKKDTGRSMPSRRPDRRKRPRRPLSGGSSPRAPLPHRAATAAVRRKTRCCRCG